MGSIGDSWLGLEDMVCVVTGAGSGIGRATAQELGTVGAKVALLDRDNAAAEAVAEAIRGNGATAMAVGCDVTSDSDVNTAAATVRDQLGVCDVLVNNAGILRPGSLGSLSIHDWENLMNVNVTGYLRCAQAFGQQMLERGSGAIVHIASIAASQPQAHSGAYSPGKAAVAMLSRQLAYEWGPRGIRSNYFAAATGAERAIAMLMKKLRGETGRKVSLIFA